MVTSLLKAGTASLALLAAPQATALVVAQVLPGSADEAMAHALEKGGAFAVILIILFFYRRDYVKLTDFWRDQTVAMKELVEKNTKAQTEVSDALRENTVVVHQAKNVMRAYLPDDPKLGRRSYDGP